jgi:ubiquinone/menaquinone biosynthesis C-methylase UbiE
MNDLKAPEDFASWNEQMIRRHDPELFYRHPFGAVRWVESLRVRALLRGLDLRPDHSLLDAGCGAGSFLHGLTCDDAYGVELSATMALRARTLLGDEVKIVQGDVEQLPFPDGRFDRVVASSLLSHVLHPEKVVSELRRVTKIGGRIVISISDEEQIERGMRWAKALGLQRLFGGDRVSEQQSAYHVEYHLHRFTLKRLRDLVAGSLDEMEVTRVPLLYPAHWVVTYGR